MTLPAAEVLMVAAYEAAFAAAGACDWFTMKSIAETVKLLATLRVVVPPGLAALQRRCKRN